jgi:GT2 family glycosyltransferase
VKARAARGRQAPEFSPRWVTELDVAMPVPDLVAPDRSDGRRYERARILIRAKGAPVGYLDVVLSDGALPAARLARALSEHADGAALGPSDDDVTASHDHEAPLVSVVVATRDRGDSLKRTLASLVAMDYPDYEIVVVDSASRTNETQRAIDAFPTSRVILARDALGGLSRARNVGARIAKGQLLAFTDDDVIVDAGWLRAVARGFGRAPDVDCVTGLVPGAELETSAQAFFDARVGWGKLRTARIYDLFEHRCEDPRFPYFTGLLGTGANFAVTRSAFDRVGPFDESLGAGSLSRGGEDLDYFLRILLSYGRIAYEPSALVWHVHRQDNRAVAQQMYGYGSGLTAFICKYLLRGETRRDVIEHLARGTGLFASTARDAYRAAPVPLTTRLAELCGMLAGPIAYLRALHHQRGSRHAA